MVHDVSSVGHASPVDDDNILTPWPPAPTEHGQGFGGAADPPLAEKVTPDARPRAALAAVRTIRLQFPRLARPARHAEQGGVPAPAHHPAQVDPPAVTAHTLTHFLIIISPFAIYDLQI